MDEALAILSNAHRRRILAVLGDHERLEFAELFGPTGGLTARHEVAVLHAHLPKLTDHGFVRWDRETGVVSRGPKYEAVRPLLDWLEDHWDDPLDGPTR